MSKSRLATLSSLLAETMASAGTDLFTAKLSNFLQIAGGYESIVMAAFPVGRRPHRLYSNLSGPDELTTIGPYFSQTYLLDPWYNMIQEAMPAGVYRLSDWAPDDFTSTSYYHTYYKKTYLVDECGVFVWLTSDLCIALMLGNRSSSNEERPGWLNELVDLHPCIAQLARMHWRDIAKIEVPPTDSLRDLCKTHGLTARESEVTDYLLRGHSNKVIARELDISPETVKVYRKRINQKLGTSSTSQVFAKFFPYI